MDTEFRRQRSEIRGQRSRSAGTRRGFTLIELIVTLVILVVVLGMAYQILDNCLRTEQWVERQGRPEKVGEAILSLIRKDLEGEVYYNLGTDRVFQLIDGGTGENARDELEFYSTREPTPLTDEETRGFGQQENIHTITAIKYYLKENSQGLQTLYRRENVAAEGDPFETGGGISYEIYDKVASLSFHCFDATGDPLTGTEAWLESWDARQRTQLAAQDELDRQAVSEGIPTVGAQGAGAVSTPEASADAATEETEAALPPAIIPSAVRVEVSIYAGDEKGIFRNQDGTPMAPRVYSAIVPLLTAQRIAISSEIASSLGQDGAAGGGGGGGSGEEGGQVTSSGPLTSSDPKSGGGRGAGRDGGGGGRGRGAGPAGAFGGGPGGGPGGGRGGGAPAGGRGGAPGGGRGGGGRAPVAPAVRGGR